MPLQAYLRPKRPGFWLDGFNGTVRSELVHLDRLLWGFWEYMARFDDAARLSMQSSELGLIALARGSHEGSKYNDRRAFKNKHYDDFHRHWRINAIAQRDAVLSVFHGSKGLSAINRFASTADETIRSRIKIEHLRKTGPLFKTLFPDAHKIRHAVAHVGEANADERLHRGPTMLSYLETPFINGASFGTKFSISSEGKLLSIDFSQQQVDGFRETARIIRAAVLPVQNWTKRCANRFLDMQERERRATDQAAVQ